MRRTLQALLIGLASVALSQTNDPFSFKDDQLGMSLREFQAKHIPDTRKSATCKQLLPSITRCDYVSTAATVDTGIIAIFVDDKLAVVHVVSQQNPDGWPLIQRALLEKLGPHPLVIRASGASNHELFALRWDNTVSVVQFEASHCGSNDDFSDVDVSKILQSRYCENSGDGTNGTTSIYYLHRELSAMLLERRKAAKDMADKKTRSDI